MAVIEKDLGPVSAYAVAVAHGYTGTEAEWEALIANSAINAQSAGASATAAAASAQEAAQQKTQAQAQAMAAQAHATQASNFANTAGQANSYAQMARSNAAVSAANASNAQTAAEAAQAAAEAAVTGAEAAQTAAEAAVTDAQTAKTAAETAAATAAAAYGTDLLADDYSTSKTYAVGDYVIYSGNLYRCTTAITTAEAWTAAHWTQAQIGPDVSDLKSALSLAVATDETWQSIELTLQAGYYDKNTGAYNAQADKRSAKFNVSVGNKYKLSTCIRSPLVSGVMFYDENDAVLDTLLDGSGTLEVITDYEFTVPNGAVSVAVQSSDSNEAVPVLSKHESEKSFRGYTKTESDNRFAPIGATSVKKYGLKWEIGNNDDSGSRCFDAIGLSAAIGIGSESGQSDFDNIYPWSEMKRCNIKQNTNGAKIITFEGETGFALDGSNGDVFVRIPKFYYEHYSNNGFEYVTVSSEGDKLHPAFVENGLVLDEIFVGAFEGLINSGKLRSVSGVIPSSNETGTTFLTDATANGKGYTLYDMRTSDAVWMLMAVEFGCRNSNRIIGYGYADFFQAVGSQWGVVSDSTATQTNVFSVAKSVPQARLDYMPIGSNIVICKGTMTNCITFAKLVERTSDADHWYLRFDGDPVNLDTTCFIGSAGCTTNFCESAPTGAMTYHTGRANWINNSNTKNPVRYRWIENIVGSLWSIFPDITFNNLQMYQCSDITKYNIGAIDNGYAAVGDLLTEQTSNGNKADDTGANYWVTKLMNPYFGKGVTFGKEWNTSLTSDKAFGAFYYLLTGRRIIANGGGFDHLYRCNMLTNRAWLDPTDVWYLYGARLQYKNI